jgi:hypothetical protein
MAEKRPLAIYSNDLEELRAGDTLPGVSVSDGDHGLAYMQANATATTISTQSVPVKAAGTTSSGLVQGFTHTDNRLTYDGTETTIFAVRADATLFGGNDELVAIEIRKNGVKVNGFVSTYSRSNKQGSTSVEALVSLATNDYVELWVSAEESNGDVTVEDMVLAVTSLKGGSGADGAAGPTGPAGAGQSAIQIIISSETGAISTGIKDYIEVPFDCTILSARLFADQTGSIVIDINKATYAGLFTTASICASALPTLSSERKSEDATLTGWTTSLSEGDVLEYEVDSATTVERVTLSLIIERD